MTKIKKIVYGILAVVPLIGTVFSLFFLPDSVPMHFDINHQVDRWGSKYEMLILPIIVLIMGAVFIFVGKSLAKNEEHGNNNYNIFSTVSIAMLVIFNVINIGLIYIALKGIENLSTGDIDFLRILVFMFGLLFIIIGNIVPKAKMNSILGLRTKWSMSSEEAWRKSQRFGGYTAIIAGLLMIVESLIFSDMTTIILMLVIIFVMAIADTVYSYFASK